MPELKSRKPRKPPAAGALINPRSPRAGTVGLQAGFDPGAPGPQPGQRLGPQLAPRPEIVAPADPFLEQPRLPPISEVRLFGTTRLLPAKYSESVLTRIANSDADLPLIFALDNATNDRLLAESNQRLGITARELVFDVPYCRIINAAFTHPHPQGARFSMPYRGAWYAGLELATAKAEVLFHRLVQFAEIGWEKPEELEYDQYTADFSGCFHDLRPAAFARAGSTPKSEPRVEPGRRFAIARRQRGHSLQAASEMPGPGSGAPVSAEFASCLTLDSYVDSQQLAIQLLEAGSLGILYPSARRPGGNCIACFRPSVVANVRKRDLYCLRWYPDRAATFVRSPRVLASADAPAMADRAPDLQSPCESEADRGAEAGAKEA